MPPMISRGPPHVRPEHLPGGRGKLRVFSLTTSQLAGELSFRLDPANPKRLAFLEPAQEMLLDNLQQALCASRADWMKVGT